MKYKEWLIEWLNNYEKMHLKARTYRNYEGAVNNHILPSLGEYELEELSFAILQGFVNEREANGIGKYGAGLSSGSVAIIINVLQKSLDIAVKMGIIDFHNASKLKRTKNDYIESECFSIDEQRAIENEVITKLPNKKIGILISLYTGLRIGELMALRWEDIDFINNIINIKHTAREVYINGKRSVVLDSPKTVSSKRTIPIPIQLIPYLLITKNASDSEYVISTKGRDTSIRSYQKIYATMIKKLNIRYRSFHTLRHTFATRALECGMDIKTLSEIMGHKSPMITLNRYSHSLTEHKIAMMNKLGTNLDRELIIDKLKFER